MTDVKQSLEWPYQMDQDAYKPLFDPVYTAFLQEFKLGAEELTIHGSLPLMAGKSFLLKQLLEGKTESGESVGQKLEPNNKGPIHLIAGNISYDRVISLFSIWCWMNGILSSQRKTYSLYDEDSEEFEDVSVEILQPPLFYDPIGLLYWINYFDIRDTTLLNQWAELMLESVKVDKDFRNSEIKSSVKGKIKIAPENVKVLNDILNKSQNLVGLSKEWKEKLKEAINEELNKNDWNEEDTKKWKEFLEEEEKEQLERAKEIQSVFHDSNGSLVVLTDIPPLS